MSATWTIFFRWVFSLKHMKAKEFWYNYTSWHQQKYNKDKDSQNFKKMAYIGRSSSRATFIYNLVFKKWNFKSIENWKCFFSAQFFRITFLECSDCLKYCSKQSSELSMIQVIKADLHWSAFVIGCWSSKPSFLLGYNVWEVLRLTNTEWRFTNVVSPLLDPFS